MKRCSFSFIMMYFVPFTACSQWSLESTSTCAVSFISSTHTAAGLLHFSCAFVPTSCVFTKCAVRCCFSPTEPPLYMRVMYNFVARNSQELTVMKGEVIQVSRRPSTVQSTTINHENVIMRTGTDKPSPCFLSLGAF